MVLSGFCRNLPAKVCYSQYFGTNDTTDADGRDPHDAVDHLHDHFVDDLEEIDDRLSLPTDGAKNSAEREAEEDDSQGVGASPVSQDLGVLGLVSCCVQLLLILGACCLEGCLGNQCDCFFFALNE